YALTRRNMRRYGGEVVPFWGVLVVLGVARPAVNPGKKQEMALGGKLQPWQDHFVGGGEKQDGKAHYTFLGGGAAVFMQRKFLTRLNPELRFFKRSGGQPDHIVANHSTLREDLYVIYEGKNPDTGHPIIKAFVNPLVAWVWIGVLVVIFGTGLALVPNAVRA